MIVETEMNLDRLPPDDMEAVRNKTIWLCVNGIYGVKSIQLNENCRKKPRH